MFSIYRRFYFPAIFLASTIVLTWPHALRAKAPEGYTLAWSDEFDKVDGPPNPLHWKYDLGKKGWGNDELEDYVDDLAHVRVVKDPQATDGSALKIEATKEGDVYKSARLKTEDLYHAHYGFIEARIRIPGGQGIWPAFWMLGANFKQISWPICGEVDIMENQGKESWSHLVQSAVHDEAIFGDNALRAQYTLKGRPFKDDYHLFQVLWEKDSLSFYVDGNLFEHRTASEVPPGKWPFNEPMFLMLNVAIGGNWVGNPDHTTVFPQRMMVDYVRVYQKTP